MIIQRYYWTCSQTSFYDVSCWTFTHTTI